MAGELKIHLILRSSEDDLKCQRPDTKSTFLPLESFIFISGQLEPQIVLSAVWTTVELNRDLFPSVFTLLLRIPQASFSWEDYRLPRKR